jgi:hypothetical protein|tara:strand:- start:120 stop:443 length:324 start_codon:yes stop_codon:yes gene_type:complete
VDIIPKFPISFLTKGHDDMKKRIHVNQHAVRGNAVNGTNHPAISVKTYKENITAHRVEIHGASSVVYSPDKPLSCGARVWIETDESVTLHGLDKEKYSLSGDRLVLS